MDWKVGTVYLTRGGWKAKVMKIVTTFGSSVFNPDVSLMDTKITVLHEIENTNGMKVYFEGIHGPKGQCYNVPECKYSDTYGTYPNMYCFDLAVSGQNPLVPQESKL